MNTSSSLIIRFLVSFAFVGASALAACGHSGVLGALDRVGTSRAIPFSAPSHVITAVNIWGEHSAYVNRDAVAKWLTWANYVQENEVSGFSADKIKTMKYTMCILSGPGFGTECYDKVKTSSDGFVYGCGLEGQVHGHYGQTQYLLNPLGSQFVPAYKDAFYTQAIHDGYDAVFFDQAGSYLGISPLPCSVGTPNPTATRIPQKDWVAMVGTALAAVPGQGVATQLFFNENGDVATNPTPMPALETALDSYTIGGRWEACYGQASAENKEELNAPWQSVEDSEIYQASQGKLFMCEAGNNLPETNPNAHPMRLYVVASFFLTYSIDSSILSEEFSDPTGPGAGFTVEPESQLVPTAPVVSAQGLTNIDSLLDGNVYVREYSTCYYAGQPLSAAFSLKNDKCVVVVNSTGSNQSFPSNLTGYNRQLQIPDALTAAGNNLLAGGSINFDGPAPAPVMSPGSAIIAAQHS